MFFQQKKIFPNQNEKIIQTPQNEEKNDTDLIYCFNISNLIQDGKPQMSSNKLAKALYEEIVGIIQDYLRDEEDLFKQAFFLELKRRIYFQLNSNETSKEVLIGIILIQVFDIENLENNIKEENIRIIIDETLKIEKYDEILRVELENNLKVFIHNFNELVYKILDGEINSALFFNQVYLHSSYIYNIRINPIILALYYSVFKMKRIKKNYVDNVYTDNNLPKITFINFEGFDNVDNFRIARNLKHLQIISIYVENSHLMISEEIENNNKDIDKTRIKKHLISIPLKSEKIDPDNFDKDIKSADFLQIFEKIIFPLIQGYRSSFIIVSHSFAFCSTANPELGMSINPKTLAIIFHKLSLFSNYKIVFVPVISIKGENPEFYDFELHKKLDYKKSFEFSECLFRALQRYHAYKDCFAFKNSNSLEANRFYIYDMLGAFIQTMNGETN